MVILEGMAHGLPIVASDVGGPAEILDHGRTGLLFPPRDVTALADQLIALVRDRRLRQRLGRAGAEEALLSWTWPKRVAAMREVYAELIQHKRSAPRFAPSGWAHAPRASASPPDSSLARGTGTGLRWPSPAVAMT
jgi:hypothetical protein